jgi:D-arabinose 1-dehydrogenase-like Zn-dependent alcohol dehydrogenase
MKTVKGFCAFSKDTAQEFVKFAEANEIKPVIAKVFEFGDVVEAFEVMQKPTTVGKFVVKISE